MKQKTNTPLFEVNDFVEVTEWLPFDCENAPPAIKGRALLVKMDFDADYTCTIFVFTAKNNKWIDSCYEGFEYYSFDTMTTCRVIKT